MKIISIDPSIANIGYAIYETEDHKLVLGTIHTKTNHSIEERIRYICQEICKLIYEHRPRQAVIEKIPEYSRKRYNGVSVNHGSLMRLHRAVGAIQAIFINAEIPIYMSPVLRSTKQIQRLNAIDICKDAAKASEHARAALIHLEKYLKQKRISHGVH
ncbi:MAG: crossover junction endodeoxyribonuclease RuvC [Candidatus Marinimicrobia bacterium]|nr:crossover junction endodeoxyribonuclease RuvC [Candidatus Neomarinimicrobiota bacterium]